MTRSGFRQTGRASRSPEGRGSRISSRTGSRFDDCARLAPLRPAPDPSDAEWRGESKPLNGASEDAHSNDTRDAERAFPARPYRRHDSTAGQPRGRCAASDRTLAIEYSFDPVSPPPSGQARELQSLRARCVLLSLCSSRAAPGGGGTARLWLSAGANQSSSTAKASVPRFGHVRACRDATGWDLPSTGARFTPQPPRRRWVWSVASVPLGGVNPSRWTAECGSMKGR